MRNPFSKLPYKTQDEHHYYKNGKLVQTQYALDLSPRGNNDLHLYAPTDGKVTYVTNKDSRYFIFVDKWGYKHFFVHAIKSKVRSYKEGKIIGILDPNPVNATGIHLHYFIQTANGSPAKVRDYYKRKGVMLFRGQQVDNFTKLIYKQRPDVKKSGMSVQVWWNKHGYGELMDKLAELKEQDVINDVKNKKLDLRTWYIKTGSKKYDNIWNAKLKPTNTNMNCQKYIDQIATLKKDQQEMGSTFRKALERAKELEKENNSLKKINQSVTERYNEYKKALKSLGISVTDENTISEAVLKWKEKNTKSQYINQYIYDLTHSQEDSKNWQKLMNTFKQPVLDRLGIKELLSTIVHKIVDKAH